MANKMFYKLKSIISAEFLLISAIFIVALLVRLYRLGGPSLCDDEIKTAIRINHSFLDTICLIRHSPIPPLHYALLNLWVRGFGNGEWALRFPSALFSGLTIIVIYKLGKELFSKSVGLIAALLLTFSPFAVNYAQNAKMYALYWFLTALSFLFFFRFLKEQKEASYRFYIGISVLCFYTMYMSVLFFVAQSMIFLLMGTRARWRKWFTGQLIIVSFCAPWAVYFLTSKHESLMLNTTLNYSLFLVDALRFIIGDFYGVWGKVNVFLWIFLMTYLLIDVLIVLHKNKRTASPSLTNYYCLFIWLAIPTFIYFLFNGFFIHSDLAYRYIGFLQVPLILLVSSQINSLQGIIKKMLLCAMIVISMSSTYVYFKDNLRSPQQDWRWPVEELTQVLGPKDVVLCIFNSSLLKYYYKADMGRFFSISRENFPPGFLNGVHLKHVYFSSGFLVKIGVNLEQVHSIFILYKIRPAPDFTLNGFTLDRRYEKGCFCLLHYRRAQYVH